jgi:hypothetical protein
MKKSWLASLLIAMTCVAGGRAQAAATASPAPARIEKSAPVRLDSRRANAAAGDEIACLGAGEATGASPADGTPGTESSPTLGPWHEEIGAQISQTRLARNGDRWFLRLAGVQQQNLMARSYRQRIDLDLLGRMLSNCATLLQRLGS